MNNNLTYRKINITEFAEKVNYSRRQITRYIQIGKLIPRRSLGGKPYFIESDIKKFLSYVLKNKDSSKPLDLTEE